MSDPAAEDNLVERWEAPVRSSGLATVYLRFRADVSASHARTGRPASPRRRLRAVSRSNCPTPIDRSDRLQPWICMGRVSWCDEGPSPLLRRLPPSDSRRCSSRRRPVTRASCHEIVSGKSCAYEKASDRPAVDPPVDAAEEDLAQELAVRLGGGGTLWRRVRDRVDDVLLSRAGRPGVNLPPLPPPDRI
jgi:hypothetical protein